MRTLQKMAAPMATPASSFAAIESVAEPQITNMRMNVTMISHATALKLLELPAG